jgi:outer membrane biosynthesis protein TonB
MIPDHELVEHSDEPAQVAVGGMNPNAIAHEGFLGFVNLRPEPQAPEPIAERPNVSIPDLAPLAFDSTPSFSIVEGDEHGLFLPEEYTAANEYLPSQNVRPPGTREILVVQKEDPEYPFVALDAGMEGVIVVLVYVDSTGELSTFPAWIAGDGIQTLEYRVGGKRKIFNYAVKENPPDWFFAKNFIKVLQKWVFAPRIEDGKPVNSLLRIKYRFCLGTNCVRYELEQLKS